MTTKGSPHYVWFKLSLVLGVALGVLLLAQSIRTYVLVSRHLVSDQLIRDARNEAIALQRHVRQEKVSDRAELANLLDEVHRDGERRIAWIKVIDQGNKTLAQSGEPVGRPFPADRIQAALRDGSPLSEVRRTPNGEVRVTVLQFRGPPRGFLELALYVESAAGVFWPLRQSLIINCSAALALLASLTLMWLRFGNYVRGKQLEQQMELARRVQQDLLPSPAAPSGTLAFAGECVPAWQVGGDFYDVFSADHGRVALVIGDVSGKGLPAALLMALLHGAVRSGVWVGTPPGHEAASRRLNELLCSRSSGERFASLFWCYYDPESELLRYVNAGHLPPFLLHGNGTEDAEALRLEGGGPVLGLIPAAEYRQGTAPFHPGDLLVLYSDGIEEAANESDEEYGEKRLCNVLRENRTEPPARIREAILSSVRAFVGREQLRDDLTLLVARVGRDPRLAG